MRLMKMAQIAAFSLCAAMVGIASASDAATTDGKAATDGNWSVLIITEKGTCGRSHINNVKVSEGRVAYQGYAPINMAGSVTPDGAVEVNISAGSQGASGTGRLQAAEGHGTWQGHSSSGECTGRWVAQRN